MREVPSEESAPTLAAQPLIEDAFVPIDRAVVERERLSLHSISTIGGPMFLLASLVIPFVGEWTPLKWCLQVSLPVGACLSLWVYLRSRRPESYSANVQRVAIVGMAFPVIVNTLYFGIFSPALLVLFLYIYLSCLNSPKLGTAIFVVVAAGHAVLATLTFTDHVAATGLVSLSVSGVEAALGEVLTQSALLAGLVVGRGSRESTIRALQQLRDANVAAARREVVAREMAAQLVLARAPGDQGYMTGADAGPYRLGRLIGRGGMGEVYQATDGKTGREIAVKVLSPTVTQTDSSLKRFQRECEALRQLHHANIVEMLDAGTTDAGLPFLAMELLRGRDLATMLRDQVTLSPSATLRLVTDVAAGLDHAQSKGIVHRDLKPQNLFYSHDDERWKILDFGIAKLLDTDDATLTHGYVIGTPTYMSPEHASSRPVDHRADLYALSALAYRALTGFPVFSAGNAPALVHAVVYDFPQLPSSLAALPPDVDRVLAIGLAKSADERFQSGAELAQALDAALASELDNALRQRGDAQLSRWKTAP